MRIARLPDEDWKFLMGDDGTGHCRGCGKKIEILDPGCVICMIALHAFMDEEPDYPALMEAARAA
jgi:hypothetical protein